MPHRDAGAADRGRHVGVGDRGPDDRLGLGHDLFRRPVVDGQRRELDPRRGRRAASRSSPRLGEPVPRLGAVADDREAARRAAGQQHLPLGIGQLLRLVHDDVRERTGEQVRARRRGSPASSTSVFWKSCPRSIDMTAISESSAAIRWSMTLDISSRSAASIASRCRRRSDASGSPMRWRAASRNGRSETVHARGSAALQRSHLVGARATVRTAAGTPATSTAAPTRAVGSSSGHARSKVRDELLVLQQRPAEERGRHVAVAPVDQDLEERLPDLIARLVVRRCRARPTRTPPPSPRRSATRRATASRPSGRSRAAARRGATAVVDRVRSSSRTTSGARHPDRSRRPPPRPPATRSRRVQICTLSSPRLGRMSSTYARYAWCGPTKSTPPPPRPMRGSE